MNLNFGAWPEHLAEAVKKNPRAALNLAAILIVVCLAGVVHFLFSVTQQQNAAVNTEKTAKISELEDDNAILRNKHDSLVVLIGEVRADGLRKELALKDTQAVELKRFNKRLETEKSAMAQELEKLRREAAENRRLSTTVKTLQAPK